MRPRSTGFRRRHQGGGFLGRAVARHERREEAGGDRALAWVDGSADRDGFAAWAVLVRFPDGRITRAAGGLPRGVSATESEIFAFLRAIEIAGGADVTIHTDCKAIADALRGATALGVPAWSEVQRAIRDGGQRIEARWRRRKSSASMIAVHHLANAARLFEVIGVPGAIELPDPAAAFA